MFGYKADAVVFYCLHMLRIIAQGQKPAVDLGVKRLNPSVEHLGETRIFAHLFYRDTVLPEEFCRAAG